MFELWARKRPIKGFGRPFELICKFDDFNYRYTALSIINKEEYQEAVIVNEEQRCIMYIEFEKTLIRKRNK